MINDKYLAQAFFSTLFNMHSYRIFVISQDDNEVFNRAMLFNVGYSEAVNLSDSEWDCLGILIE